MMKAHDRGGIEGVVIHKRPVTVVSPRCRVLRRDSSLSRRPHTAQPLNSTCKEINNQHKPPLSARLQRITDILHRGENRYLNGGYIRSRFTRSEIGSSKTSSLESHGKVAVTQASTSQTIDLHIDLQNGVDIQRLSENNIGYNKESHVIAANPRHQERYLEGENLSEGSSDSGEDDAFKDYHTSHAERNNLSDYEDQREGLIYFNNRMAYLDTQERDNPASPWLQYHLGQSTGYCELSKKLQKRTRQPSSRVLRHSGSLGQKSFHSSQESLSLVHSDNNNNGFNRKIQKNINPADYFWSSRGLKPTVANGNVRGGRRGSISRPPSGGGSTESAQTNKKSGNGESVRGSRSARNRLLGTSRIEFGALSGQSSRTKLYNQDNTEESDILFLRVTNSSSGYNRLPSGYTAPNNSADIHNRQRLGHNSAIITVKYNDRESSTKYKLGPEKANSVDNNEFQQFPIKPNHIARTDCPDENNGSVSSESEIDNILPADQPQKSDQIEGISANKDKWKVENEITAGYAHGKLSIDKDSTPSGSSSEQVTNLTVSDFFAVSVNDGQSVVKYTNSVDYEKDSLDSRESNSDGTDETKEKRSVRFSITHEVHEYEPWRPIDGSGDGSDEEIEESADTLLQDQESNAPIDNQTLENHIEVSHEHPS